MRWQHPRQGLISPDRFIPLAEESRLILPIGNWVIWEACRQAKTWQDEGHPPSVMAVNLSAIQLQDSGFVAKVQETLANTGLDPQWLELEITESVIMENPEQVVGTLEELKALGLRLSIDDFGTGYSSLSYLKQLSVDKLKIDQSFIRDLHQDKDSAEIVRAIIQLGHILQLTVVAEGVETEEQLAFLSQSHCDQMQGYLFSRPVAAEHIPEISARVGVKN